MVLYLIKMGALFADGFRLFYQKVCCDLCCCKRCERARRRRRGTVVLHQARSGASAGAYLYGAAGSGVKALAPPTGSDPTAEAGSDVAATTSDRKRPGFVRDGGGVVTSAPPGGGGPATTLHGSLPRSGNRHWKTAHVYETISLVDDVSACDATTRGRQRWSSHQRPSEVAGAAPTRGTPHQWRNAWGPAEPLIFPQDRFLHGAERERERRRSRVVESRDAGGERAGEWRSPPERKYSSLPRQASLYARSERRASRVGGPETTAKDRMRQQFPERVEAKMAVNGRSDSTVSPLRRASANAIGSSGGTVPSSRAVLPTAEGHQRGAASKNQRTKKKKTTTKARWKRGEKIDAAAEGEPRVGPGAGQGLRSQLGQSDESFVTAPPGDSSADPPTTDEEDAVVVPAVSLRKRKKNSAAAAARRKTAKQEEPDAMQLMPMTSTSVEDSELARSQECTTKPASAANTVSDGVCPYGGGGGGGPRGKRRVPIGACLLVLLAYVFSGTVAFCLWEGWDHVTGAYFCFVSLGTIGFGDFVPGSRSGTGSTEKLLVLVLWLVLGLTLVAMCLTLTAENFDRKSSTASGGQDS